MKHPLAVIFPLYPSPQFLIDLMLDLDKACVRDRNALSELKQSTFAYNTTKMLISDVFDVVYRIIDQFLIETILHLKPKFVS